MSTIPPAGLPLDAQQRLASAVAHRIETMSKEEIQAVVERAEADALAENAVLRQRGKELEAEKLRLLYQISRRFFDPKDYEDFNPSEYGGSAEELLSLIEALPHSQD